MRVLVLSPFPLFPQTHGGRVRPYRQAVALARTGAEVVVLCPWWFGLPAWPFRRDGIRVIPYRPPARAVALTLPAAWLSPLAVLSDRRGHPALERLVRRLAPDVLEVHFCAHAHLLERLAGSVATAYVAHNVEVDYLAHQPARLARSRAVAQSVRDLERRAVTSSDLVVACSGADADRLGDLYGVGDVQVIGHGGLANGTGRNGVRERARAELGLAPDDLAVLFLGGPAPHNRRAVRFLETVLATQVERPLRLFIAGRCAPRRPSRRSPRVRRFGFVGDLEPLLAATDVAVNIDGAGSGSSMKVAEYLGAGIPVLTTPEGMRGFEQYEDRFLVAPLERFAATLEALVPANHVRAAPEGLGWDCAGVRLREIYDRLLA